MTSGERGPRVSSRRVIACWALLAALALGWGGCASNQCDFHTQCGPQHYCRLGHCLQECTADIDCDPGSRCNEIGQCVASSDAQISLSDGGLGGIDGGPRDGGGRDAFVPPPRDGGRDARVVVADAFVPARDAGPPPMQDAGSIPRDAGSDAGTPVGPLAPSPYTYQRVAAGGLREAVAVAFHPDGSYAIVLERNDGVHLYDWASRTATRLDVRVAGRSVYLTDIEFADDGSVAWITGYERVGTNDTGVILALDDARYRAGDGLAAFSRLSATATGERFTAILRPRAPSSGPAGDGRPVVLSQSGSSPYIARLRELDPATGAFAGLFVARATSAGCDDLAFADNEFGGWGIVLACGVNGADAPYYTSIAGVGEWRAGPVSLGNVSRAAGHPSGAYALIVNWSSRWLHRFESGAFRPTGGSPGVANGIYDVSFSPDGRLALVTGRAIGTVLRGTVFEYRHDLWSASEITDVSIEGFSAAPYLATSNTYLLDSAFRPGCEGGLIVGGQGSPASVGMIVEFQRATGRACR